MVLTPDDNQLNQEDLISCTWLLLLMLKSVISFPHNTKVYGEVFGEIITTVCNMLFFKHLSSLLCAWIQMYLHFTMLSILTVSRFYLAFYNLFIIHLFTQTRNPHNSCAGLCITWRDRSTTNVLAKNDNSDFITLSTVTVHSWIVMGVTWHETHSVKWVKKSLYNIFI